MDRSLDEIIAERPQSSNRNRRGPRRGNRPRDRVHKSYREDRVDPDLDWVHDKFEDDGDTRRPYRGPRSFRNDRSPPATDPAANGAKLRVTNLHYDLTEDDLTDLFTRIGPIISLSLVYDRAGRSEGIAYVTYKRLVDAQSAIREFDGANAKGQPIRLTLISSGKPRNPFDTAEMPKRSLFERAERPRHRNPRSMSPDDDSESLERSGRGGRERRRTGRVDRYIPGGASPRRRDDGGRRRNDSRRRTGNARPKKTQEELDQEMEDYWGSASAAPATAAASNGAAETVQTNVSAASNIDDDIDMNIE
ncbi:hypothetical protein VTO42DRAFT_5589 [Malbranchea cinnamomea]